MFFSVFQCGFSGFASDFFPWIFGKEVPHVLVHEVIVHKIFLFILIDEVVADRWKVVVVVVLEPFFPCTWKDRRVFQYKIIAEIWSWSDIAGNEASWGMAQYGYLFISFAFYKFNQIIALAYYIVFFPVVGAFSVAIAINQNQMESFWQFLDYIGIAAWVCTLGMNYQKYGVAAVSFIIVDYAVVRCLVLAIFKFHSHTPVQGQSFWISLYGYSF